MVINYSYKYFFTATLLVMFLACKNVYSVEEVQVISLFAYLKQVSIPKDVEDLAKKGYEHYRSSPLKEKLDTLKLDQAPGARSGDWIFDTFGMKEAEILNGLRELPAPLTWTVREIDLAYQEMIKTFIKKATEKAHFILVKGLGVSGLHRTELGKDSIVQLASQFNYLESASSDLTNVSDYVFDWTQGPLGAIEAASAALYRHVAVTSFKLQHALCNILPSESDEMCSEEVSYYKNGYLMLNKASEKEKELLLKSVSEKIDKLEILPQWVMCESSGAIQLQVFSSAPSFQGTKMPDADSVETVICKKLVASQYEAIAKLAVLQSLLQAKEIRLHLTLVGQGAFNNPPDVMTEALNRVANIVKGCSVKVFVHVFGDVAKNKFLQAKDDSFTFEEISREVFIQTSTNQ